MNAFFFVIRLAILVGVGIGAVNLSIGFALTDPKSLLSGLGGLVLAPMLWRKHFDDNGTFYALMLLSFGFSILLRALVA